MDLLFKVCLFLFLAGLAWAVLCSMTQLVYDRMFDKPILDAQEFDAVFWQEMKSLQLDNTVVKYHLRDSKSWMGPQGICKKEDNGSYTIYFFRPSGLKRTIIRHELYHAYAKHHYKTSLSKEERLIKELEDPNTHFISKAFKFIQISTSLLCKLFLKICKSTFWNDPTADLYAVFGLKL